MPGEILDGLQSLHFNILTLSPTKVNWVKKWSKAQVISFIGLTMWVLFFRGGKTQLRARVMVFRRIQ
jgi:hypothetical protein